MSDLLIWFFLFLNQLILFFGSKVNIYPEFLIFPYLVLRGQIPYVDFFDHHGFLPYYLLSLFSFDKTLFFLHFVFYLLHFLNLLLVLLILKKITSKSGLFLGGLIFVFLSYFFSDQTLWYELFITFFYLAIYLLLMDKKRKNGILIGFLIALSSFTKITAALIILPILLIKKDIKIFFGFILPWFLVILIFFWQKALSRLVEGIFLFNFFLGKYYPKNPIFDWRILIFIFFLLTFIIFFILVKKKFEKIKLILIFLFCSLIFVSLKYARYHLLPFVSFFSILVGVAFGIFIKEKNFLGKFFLAIVLIFIFLFGRKIKHQYFYFKNNRQVWIDNKVSQMVISSLRKKKLNKKQVFILGNRPEIYYFLNQLPPTYFPVILPFVPEFYSSFFEKDLINALRSTNVVIVFKDDLAKKILKSKGAKNLIDNKFKLIQEKKEEYQIYFQSGR